MRSGASFPSGPVIALGLVAAVAACRPSREGRAPRDDKADGAVSEFVMKASLPGESRMRRFDTASGELCDHCGGGPETSFGGTLTLEGGREVQLWVSLDDYCDLPMPYDVGLGAGHATLRTRDGAGSWRDQTAREGRVVAQRCDIGRGYIAVRFVLTFESGKVRGTARGPVDLDAGYD